MLHWARGRRAVPACAPQNGVALTDLIATILAGVNKDEVIQYILAMLDELLIGAPPAAPHRPASGRGHTPWAEPRTPRACLAVQPRIAGYFHELLISSKGYNDPFGAPALC